MEKLSSIINSYWFKSAAVAAVGVFVWINGNPLWAGVAFGWAANEFMEYLKPSK